MCFSQIGIFDTENTETPPSPESRLRAIDGGGTSPDYKPSGLNRRRPTAVTLRVFRARRRHGNSPCGRKTRKRKVEARSWSRRVEGYFFFSMPSDPRGRALKGK